MLIRCSNCNKIIDLKTRIMIESFIKGIPIKCKNCKKEIYFKEEK